MPLAQSLTHQTKLAMTQQMQASLRILRMNNQDLADYRVERALENPCIELRLPNLALQSRLHPSPHWDGVGALAAEQPSLIAHVAAQIKLAFSDLRDQEIAFAFAFLEALEPSGWLGSTVPAIAVTCAVKETRAEAVLARLQQFEPAGLFARDLAECLQLQALDQDLLTWELEALIQHLPLLLERKYSDLAEICDCSPTEIPFITATLRRFDLKPGHRFSDERTPIYPPDLSIKRSEGGWKVALNRSTLPSIQIAPALPVANDNVARAFRTKALAEARWLTRTLQARKVTLLRIASAIIAHQRAFLEHGRGHLRPLRLDDIAQELDLHASTVSRAISERMIETPTGAIPMKALFCSSFEAAGEDQSQGSVVQLVRRIVLAEDRTSPLSDKAIARLAALEGVSLARRTVTKYRDILGIASSFERRLSAVAN